MLTQPQINEVVQRIVTNCAPDKILLFGSYANGTATENSDLDLIVVKDTNLPQHKRGYDIIKYLKGLLIPIDILVYSYDEIVQAKDEKFTFLYEVLKSIKILYEKK